MTAAMDPYGVLGLQPGASQAEVKRAYRRLAKVLHPDSAGERSLPAFLAVQDAYERLTGTKVRTVRPAGAGPTPPAPANGGPFREPWRADPARARAAREQARTRARSAGGSGTAGGPGPATGGPAAAGTGPSGSTGATGAPGAPGRTGWARSEQRARAASDSSRHANPDDATSGGQPTGGAAASGRRRRSTRKATMGSTSYDDARDAADPRWAGASWYGPTTGEYWIVNPREYADPRKHGPGYSSRLRTGSGGIQEPVLEDAGPDDTPRPTTDRPIDGARDASLGAAPPTATTTATPRHEPADEPLIDAIIRSGSGDPLHRVGLVLVAWAPVGIAAAAVIGQLTGCASFSAACDGTDPFLPWVAQAIVVGLLLIATPLARVFASGTIGLIVGLVPATALVIALGGAGSSAAAPVLAVVLAIAWLLGSAWGLRRLVADRAPAASPEP